MTEAEKMRLMIRLINKIDELAADGQNGSANYALDRLAMIRESSKTVMKRIRQWP